MADDGFLRRRTLASVSIRASALGVLLGVTAYLVAPLPVHPDANADVPVVASSPASSVPTVPPPTPSASTPAPLPPSAAPVATTSTAAAPTSTPSGDQPGSPGASATSTDGPPFTELALLQTSEFLEYGWGKAAELSLVKGVPGPPLLRCVDVADLPQRPVAAYAATYQGLHTQAGEQVLRYADPADAAGALDRLVAQVRGCETQPPARRVVVGERHDPRLTRISQAVWWNVRGGEGDGTRGVLGLLRLDDRVVALELESKTTDPAVTTDIDPLLRQAGLRLT